MPTQICVEFGDDLKLWMSACSWLHITKKQQQKTNIKLVANPMKIYFGITGILHRAQLEISWAPS